MKNSILKITPKEFADRYCQFSVYPAAENFVRERWSMAQVWDDCDDIGFLIFILDKIGYEDEKLRLFAAWCVRNTPLDESSKTSDFLTDPRLTKVLETAELYVERRATVTDMENADARVLSALRDLCFLAAYALPQNVKSSRFKRGIAFAVRNILIENPWKAANLVVMNLLELSESKKLAQKAQADQLREIIGNPFCESVEIS